MLESVVLLVQQVILIGGRVVPVAKEWPSLDTVKLPYVTWATVCEHRPIDV